ncbi:alpha-galactosidase [Streptosporangium sp. LJ11]|uniref:alpha-galactosidase n=1 Tax=Streptosporangium sp. LJ11 TaxID=3436927 RepID=UPI003F7929F6
MPLVTYLADRRLWLLRTPGSSYALALDADDCPRHLHWGPSLTAEQVPAVPPALRRDASSFTLGGYGELEGPGFGAPSLRVIYADHGEGVEWRYLDHSIDEGHLSIRFADRHHPLEITLHYRVHADSDVIERWTTLRHTGTEPITLERCDSAAWTLPMREEVRLSHVVGGWSSENQVRREELPVGETVLTSRRGATGHHANPWVMLDDGTATEERGEVWSAALAWSGSWRITVQRPPFDAVGFTGGFGHEGLRWRLEAGQSWHTPVFSGVYGTAGFGGISRAWHAHARRHVLTHPEELRPVVYNSWEATGFDVDLDGQLRLADRAAAAGAELFVLDDGWFGKRGSDRAGLGDWHVNPRRFPGGLDTLIAGVHERGMRFGLWVEPEMVNPDSDLYREHPDWVLHMPNRHRLTLRNQLVLNFARPDVAAWAYGWLNRLLADHEIDFLKWDFNRAFTQAGWPGQDDPDRLWIDHVRNVYTIMDRLRAAHPGVRIEACAGGGGRTDLGILGRTDQVWTSDNTDAVDRLAIQHGFGQIYPPGVMGAWVTDSPNPLTGRLVPLRFRFHVAMAGVLGLGGDLPAWSDADLAEAGELVARYKRIRPVVQHGELHRLGAPGDSLSGVQYVRGDDIVIFAYRVATRFGHRAARLRPAGLDPDGRYHDVDTGRIHHGVILAAHGLELELPPGDYASTQIHLVRQDSPAAGHRSGSATRSSK